MTSARENKWAADAEMCMQGYVIEVQGEDHAKFMTGYILNTLYGEREDADYLIGKASEIVQNAQDKYASKTREVSYMTVSRLMGEFIVLTFVVDKKPLTKKNGDLTSVGNLCWVENLDAPECSELGYCYFKKNSFGKVVRYA